MRPQRGDGRLDTSPDVAVTGIRIVACRNAARFYIEDIDYEQRNVREIERGKKSFQT